MGTLGLDSNHTGVDHQMPTKLLVTDITTVNESNASLPTLNKDLSE